MDADHCYRAVSSRDPRFDGAFCTGVLTTGIYCRPSCPARTPRRANVRFYPSPAAAQGAGLRACKRCRPDATPGSPEWDVRADLAGRAMRLVTDGLVDREGVAGLAARLGYSQRQVHRTLVEQVGAGPQALARAQRAHTARVLLETTRLPVTQVAFASGFASVRQFNDTVRAVYAATPSALRRAIRPTVAAVPAGALELRLPYRRPCDIDGVLHFLGAHAVAGVETYDGRTYRRTLDLPHGPGVVALSAGAGPGAGTAAGYAHATLRLSDLRDATAAVARCRRLLDLDADPVAIDEALSADPMLAPLVARSPGRRVAGSVDGDEAAARAVLGQQVSLAGARSLGAKLVRRFGQPLEHPDDALTHLFPRPEALAGAADAELPMPGGRQRALRAVCGALAAGEITLDAGADRDEVERRLLALPGVGTWTAAVVRLRALGDPDVFLAGDLVVRRVLERLGLPGDPAAATALAERFRPWRSYALHHLWGEVVSRPESDDGGNRDVVDNNAEPGRRAAARRRRRGPDGRVHDPAQGVTRRGTGLAP